MMVCTEITHSTIDPKIMPQSWSIYSMSIVRVKVKVRVFKPRLLEGETRYFLALRVKFVHKVDKFSIIIRQTLNISTNAGKLRKVKAR